MNRKPDLRLWPSGKAQWAEFAAKIEAEKRAAATAHWRDPDDEAPPTPEEEEMLF